MPPKCLYSKGQMLYGVDFPNLAALNRAATISLNENKAARVQKGRIIRREEL